MMSLLGAGWACTNAAEPPVVPAVAPAATTAPTASAASKAPTPPAATTAAPTTASTTASPGLSPTLCADLGTLIEAARKNFPGLRRQDRPVSIEHQPGFESTVVLAGATACRILTSEKPYPDAYECDLAKIESHAQAKAVIDRWASVVATCPVLATWKASKPDDLGRSWELETGDDHELVVRLFTAGDDKARPTLVVRRNEI
jgi:hypothetical protein